ncbi:MAG: hypothetical protein ACOCQ4_03260 [bacterium]
MKNQGKKHRISIKRLKTEDYVCFDDLKELIENLANSGIEEIDIQNYPPYDEQANTIKSNLSIFDLTDKEFQLLTKKTRPYNFIKVIKTQPYPIVLEDEMIDKKYLPFKESQLQQYFANPNHIKHYTESANKYADWLNNKEKFNSSDYRVNRQIEKDERFWIAQSFITIFEQLDENKKIRDLRELLVKAFRDTPPLENIKSWENALQVNGNGKLILRFEENIPSPRSYKKLLRNNIQKRQFIPYILDNAEKNETEYRENLEGATNVDTLILNTSNGFNIFIEGKVLSDISSDITYDVFRNQIARSIDVMTTNHDFADKDDIRRNLNPKKSFFILLTPKLFQDNPHSRLYGYKFEEYKNQPLALMADLNHRTDIEPYEWKDILKRIGWLTWEDINQVNRKCCNWLKR